MADSTIDSELILLHNNWGPPDHGQSNRIPDGDGTWDGADSHNVEAAAYPIGTVVKCVNDGASAGQQGPYEMAYLRAEEAIAAAKDVCSPGATDDHFSVSDDPDTVLVATSAMCAVAISAMTAQYYGWFWVGGVCPEAHVTGTMGGNYRTDGNVAIGPIDVKDVADEDFLGFGAAAVDSCGFAYSADA